MKINCFLCFFQFFVAFVNIFLQIFLCTFSPTTKMSFLKCKSMDKFFLLTLRLPPRWKTTTMTMTTTTGRVGEKQIMQLVLRLATSSRQQQADLLESCFWNSLAATTNASSFSRSKAFHPTGATATKTKVQQPHGAANQLVDCKLVC